MIYIASPYTHKDEQIRNLRYKQVHRYTRLCMFRGEIVFSPIVYGHEFALIDQRAITHDYWLRFNEHMLLTAHQLRVLQLPGWDRSVGVQAEIAFADHNNIPVVFTTYPNIEEALKNESV